MSIERGVGRFGQEPFFREEARGGLKRKREAGEEPPPKRVKVDASSMVKNIDELASRSKVDFQKTEAVDTLIHSLFSNVMSGEFPVAQAEAKTLKKNLMVLKSRVTEHPLLDKATRKKCKTELTSVLETIRGKKAMEVETAVPKSVISLVNLDESFVAGLWARGHIKVDDETNLVFSDELSKRLDDEALEAILKFSPKDSLGAASNIDLGSYPGLGMQAPALVAKYLARDTAPGFACMAELPTRFCDHRLVIEDEDKIPVEKFPVNKAFLGSVSPYFKALFESPMQEGVEETATTLHDVDPKMVRWCLNSLMNRFDPTKIQNINSALSLLHHAEQLMLTSVADDTAVAIEKIIESLSTDDLQLLDDLVRELQPHFSPERFVDLQESIVTKCATILDELVKSGETPGNTETEKMIYLFGELQKTAHLAQFPPLLKMLAKHSLSFPGLLSHIISWIKPEYIPINELPEREKVDLMPKLYDAYKTTSNEAYRQMAKKMYQDLSEKASMGFYVLVDILRNGSTEEKNQAKELLKIQENEGFESSFLKAILLADILYKDEKNPQQAVALLGEVLSRAPPHTRGFSDYYLLFHLSHLQPPPVEEIKNLLRKTDHQDPTDFINQWCRYLIEKQENPQLIPKKVFLAQVRTMLEMKKQMSPFELLDPNRIEMRMIEDLPETLKQQALAFDIKTVGDMEKLLREESGAMESEAMEEESEEI